MSYCYFLKKIYSLLKIKKKRIKEWQSSKENKCELKKKMMLGEKNN